MILQILGIIFVIVATYFIFKTAKENGRNPLGWALTAFGVGIGMQFIIPIILSIVVAFIFMATGTRADQLPVVIQTPSTIITFVCLGLSLVGVFMILRHISTHREEPEIDDPPPPPPTFDDHE